MNKLYLDGKILLTEKIAAEYADYVGMGLTSCPAEIVYKIRSKDENSEIVRSARITALLEINDNKIKKYAFDTRKVDQEEDRNPRVNLQYWHRTDPFTNEDDNRKIKIFASLMNALSDMKNDLGKEPEWMESYARVLYDTVERILLIKHANLDVYRPQLLYLEQLIFARYRLNMDDLIKLGAYEIRERLLSKDESLKKRSDYIMETGGFTKESVKENVLETKGGSTPQQPVQYMPKQRSNGVSSNVDLNSIFAGSDFGGSGFRHNGEHSVERTITIKITDTVID